MEKSLQKIIHTSSIRNRSRILQSHKTPTLPHARDFTHKLHYKNDKFLILATDGLWDELTPEEACIVVHDNMEKQGKESIVETNATVSNIIYVCNKYLNMTNISHIHLHILGSVECCKSKNSTPGRCYSGRAREHIPGNDGGY